MNYFNKIIKCINEQPNNVVFGTNSVDYKVPTPHEIKALFKMGYIYKITTETLWDNTQLTSAKIFSKDKDIVMNRLVSKYYEALSINKSTFSFFVTGLERNILELSAKILEQVYGIKFLSTGNKIQVYIDEEILK